MFIEIHMLQNFAPSCLNRDDTNAPKDCVFGGARRARISSQCIKRAIREDFRLRHLPPETLSVRTKRLVRRIAEALSAAGKSDEDALAAAELCVCQVLPKSTRKNDELLTPYVLPLGTGEVKALCAYLVEHWDDLSEAIAGYRQAATLEDEKKAQKEREDADKKAAKNKNFRKDLVALLDGKKTVDLALFGRMVADLPEKNIDAACQVAHAISTHKVEMEMDFYTAVDDLKPEDTSGADMMGTVEFNSACFYRYAVIDWKKLVENLGGDTDLARRTVEAFLRASVEAIPTGKQNTFAAHNPPSFVMAAVRDEGVPWSLANAFERPVRSNSQGVVKGSIEALAEYWSQLVRMYGGSPNSLAWVSLDGEGHAALGEPEATMEAVVQKTLQPLPGGAS